MSDECDVCGLESDCCCYMYKLEERIILLELGLDQLTEVVKKISDYVRKEKDEM